MLIQCPECSHHVSDIAISCPCCGYPLKPVKNPRSRTSTRKIKRGNGTGSVYKLSGNRRNPWVASKTFGWDIDADAETAKQIRRPIGYFPTEAEAYLALEQYNANPYDIAVNAITFEEVYKLWSDEYYPTLKNKSSCRTYVAAFKWCRDIWLMRMRDIRVDHMQGVIKSCSAGDSTKSRIKSMFNMIYNYCMVHEIVEKNYSSLFSAVNAESKIDRVPYTSEEIYLLWNHTDHIYVDTILFAIYSGCRPMEVFTIRTADVHLDDGYIRGGFKTDAGTYRVIPIHEKIRPIVELHYKLGNEYLFMNHKTKSSVVPMTYDAYKGKYARIMKTYGMKHYPADPRHTFITAAKELGMNEYLLKLIVGHEINDVTEKVYTHRKIRELIDAMQIVKY